MSLLPLNSTKTEKSLSNVTASLFDVPCDISTIWQPAKCPSELLPFLAWTVAVDSWDDALTDTQKRQAIASSIEVHRKKGTRGAMNTALNSLGYSLNFKEWFEHEPRRQPFTFDLQINVINTPLHYRQYSQLEQVINKTKNERSHLARITVFTKTIGSVCFCSYARTGSTTYISAKGESH